MRRLAPVATCVLACLLAACGREQVEVGDPNALIKPGGPTREVDFPRAGMRVRVPREVRVERQRPPGVFRFGLPSGAVVSALAYRRREAVPRSASELRAARRRLVGAVRERDRTFQLERSGPVRAGGAPGVEVVGTQSLSGGRLETRSVHLFKGQTEYVLELIAPERDFPSADRAVFSPLLRSLDVTGARAP